MAHFAELNSSNEVLKVVVISNTDVDANGGDQHADAETFVTNLLGHESGGVACIPCGHTETYCNPGVEDMVCLRCFELYEYQEAGSCEGYYTNQGYYIGSEGAYGEGFYRRDLGRVVGGNLWKVERLHRLIVGAEE